MAQQDCLDCHVSQVFPALLERRALEGQQELPVHQVKKKKHFGFKMSLNFKFHFIKGTAGTAGTAGSNGAPGG
jgi:hypothetical protein